jgi:hypothetical protein
MGRICWRHFSDSFRTVGAPDTKTPNVCMAIFPFNCEFALIVNFRGGTGRLLVPQESPFFLVVQ